MKNLEKLLLIQHISTPVCKLQHPLGSGRATEHDFALWVQFVNVEMGIMCAHGTDSCVFPHGGGAGDPTDRREEETVTFIFVADRGRPRWTRRHDQQVLHECSTLPLYTWPVSSKG